MKASEIVSRLLSPSAFIEAFVTAMVFAWIAGRLLGAGRRAWRVVVATGALGWVTGVLVATALVNGDLENPSFRSLYVLFMLLFVMLATILGEVWAKQGRPRVVPRLSIPHPIRTLRRRYRLARRLGEITRIAARNGLGGVLGLRRETAAQSDTALALAVRARTALEEAGGMFVKLGQLAAGRSDLLGEDVAAEFSRLQDAVPPEPPEAIRELLETELGRAVEDVFLDFEWEPIGAASIGQAHLARLRDGSEVIVKVRRPGIADLVDRDLQIVARLAEIAERRTEWGPSIGVVSLVEEFSENLRAELDYGVEAESAAQVDAALTEIDAIRVPHIDRTLSTSRIMVMERLDGVPLSRANTITTWPRDRARLARAMLQASVGPMLSGERFHADMHPGNVFLLTDGRLGLIDFGATGRLDAFEQAAVTDILLGIRTRDPELMREAVMSVGKPRAEVDGRALERALARFMARHVEGGGSGSAAMLNELLQLLGDFGILLPASTGAMFRALATMEGTIAVIEPDFPIIEAAQEVGGDLVRDRFSDGQLEELARQEAIKLAPVLRRLPRHVDRLATMAEQGELTGRVSLLSTEQDVIVVRALLARAMLAFVGAVFMAVGVALLWTEGGPAISQATSLFDVLGYLGLFLGLILLLRVTLASLQDSAAGE
jgi:ubiquinone biosynthesis protein